MAASLLSIPPKGAPANASLWQPLYKFWRGEDTTKRVLGASNDSVNPTAQLHNVDPTNGRGLWVTYGDLSSPTVIFKAEKAAITLNAPLLTTGDVLSLQSSAGKSVSIIQGGFTTAIVFGLQVAKTHSATTASGSAAAQFSLITWDTSTPGVDSTTLKVIHDASGPSVGLDSTIRGIEIPIGRFASNTSTTAAGYSLGTATPPDYGSTRAIAIGLYHDPLITDPPRDHFSLTGVDVSNTGSGGVTGRSWDGVSTVSNKGTVAFNAWGGDGIGGGGFRYGFMYTGSFASSNLLSNTTGRVFHVAETVGPSASGVDQMWLANALASGTGFMLTNTSSGTFQRSLVVQGSGGSHPGALSIWNHTDARYMVMFWKSLTSPFTDQILAVPDGTAGIPVWGWSTCLTMGFFKQATDAIGISTASTERVRIDANGNWGFKAFSFGSGVGVMCIGNAGTVPTTNPTGGGVLYAEGGAGKWRSSGGTVTTFGTAEPHCPTCDRDFALEWESDRYGRLAVCVWCLTEGNPKGVIERRAA